MFEPWCEMSWKPFNYFSSLILYKVKFLGVWFLSSRSLMPLSDFFNTYAVGSQAHTHKNTHCLLSAFPRALKAGHCLLIIAVSNLLYIWTHLCLQMPHSVSRWELSSLMWLCDGMWGCMNRCTLSSSREERAALHSVITHSGLWLWPRALSCHWRKLIHHNTCPTTDRHRDRGANWWGRRAMPAVSGSAYLWSRHAHVVPEPPAPTGELSLKWHTFIHSTRDNWLENWARHCLRCLLRLCWDRVQI